MEPNIFSVGGDTIKGQLAFAQYKRSPVFSVFSVFAPIFLQSSLLVLMISCSDVGAGKRVYMSRGRVGPKGWAVGLVSKPSSISFQRRKTQFSASVRLPHMVCFATELPRTRTVATGARAIHTNFLFLLFAHQTPTAMALL